MKGGSVFCDSSVLLRYWTGDDPPRALAAARIVESERELVVSTGVILETVHTLRRDYRVANPELGRLLIGFLTRANVRLADADKPAAVEGLRWTLDRSARRIPDALIAAAAECAGCAAIATFDESFSSPSVPVQLL